MPAAGKPGKSYRNNLLTWHHLRMADRWTAPGGWVVDVIRLSLTGTGRDGTWLRIRRHGCWIADVRTVAEIETFIPLASLEPDELRTGTADRHRTHGGSRPGGTYWP